MLCYSLSAWSARSKALPHVISLLSWHLPDHSNFILSLQHNQITTKELCRISYSNHVQYSGLGLLEVSKYGRYDWWVLELSSSEKHHPGVITFFLGELHCGFLCASPCHPTMIYNATEYVELCAWVNKWIKGEKNILQGKNKECQLKWHGKVEA